MEIGIKKKAKKKSSELGFGTKAYGPNTRLINQGGGFNVDKTGLSSWKSTDAYHELISMTWVRFILLASGLFFLANLFFAFLYFGAGTDSISGPIGESNWDKFLDAFYFSTQTITTLGYGHLSPSSNYVSLLAAIESFLGLLGFALVTGLMYARFSRPRKRIVYSQHSIIAPFKKGNALMFRFANSGKNHLIEAEVDLICSYWNKEEERRIFEKLELERGKINFLTTSWTVVHPITDDSPLYGLSHEDCKDSHMEIIVMFKAFDDTYARNIYDRNSYIYEEMLWGKKFVPIFEERGDGKIHIDLSQIGKTKDAKLN